MAIPTWITKEIEKYNCNRSSSKKSFANSDFGRFLLHARTIGLEDLLPKKKSLNVLVVGPSGHDIFGYQHYELFEMMAYIKKCGKDYNAIDVVDIIPESLAELIDTEQIKVPFCWENEKMFQNAWKEYHLYMFGKNVEEHKNNDHAGIDLPPQFKDDIDNRKIITYCDDIVTTSLPLNGKKYDLIVCRNVLYQLSDSGQKVALYNFARSMGDDSLLMISLGGELGGIKFPDLRSWFNEDFQRELELKIVENTYNTIIQRI
jgi:hypothetical protein